MATTTDVSRTLSRLTRIKPGKHWIVSCYLKLEPRDRTRRKYLIKLKNRVRAALETLNGDGFPRAAREHLRHDLERIQDYLGSSTRLPSTRGVALFASEPLDLFETVPLPWVYRSRLAVDRTPLIRELTTVEDEFGRMLAVVFDRTAARYFEVTAFDVRELEGLVAEASRGGKYHSDREDAPGMGEGTWNNRIRSEKQRHFANVAQRLFELHRQHPADGIVLAGPGAEAGAVEPFLHPYLAERLVGIARVNPKTATPAEVREAVLDVREGHERASEREMVRELEEALGAKWAVAGIRDTLLALGNGQVRTLLVDADEARPGFRCSSSGRLMLREDDCIAEGQPIPVLDVIDEAIEEALRQRATIEVIYDEEARRAVCGLAGLLRFR